MADHKPGVGAHGLALLLVFIQLFQLIACDCYKTRHGEYVCNYDMFASWYICVNADGVTQFGWYMWFGFGWMVIILIGMCMGLYRRYKMRQAQIRQGNVVTLHTRNQPHVPPTVPAVPLKPPSYESVIQPTNPYGAPPPYSETVSDETQEQPANHLQTAGYPPNFIQYSPVGGYPPPNDPAYPPSNNRRF